MKITKSGLIAKQKDATDLILKQAAKLAGLAQGLRETDEMLSIDLQDVEANLRQVAAGLLQVENGNDEQG